MKRGFGSVVLMLLLNASSWAAVDLNTATQAELEAVRGIGPAKAKAIVVHREKNGPFKTLDGLAEVKGFGKASVDKLKNELTVAKAADKTEKK